MQAKPTIALGPDELPRWKDLWEAAEAQGRRKLLKVLAALRKGIDPSNERVSAARQLDRVAADLGWIAGETPVPDAATARGVLAIGDIVRVRDGTPLPPARHTRKRKNWELHNFAGFVDKIEDDKAALGPRVGVDETGGRVLVISLDPREVDITKPFGVVGAAEEEASAEEEAAADADMPEPGL